MEALTQIREGVLCLQATPIATLSDCELVEVGLQLERLEVLLAAQRARFAGPRASRCDFGDDDGDDWLVGLTDHGP